MELESANGAKAAKLTQGTVVVNLVLLGHVVRLGHLLRDKKLLDLLRSKEALLDEDGSDGLVGLVGNLGSLGSVLVANVRKKSSDDTNGVVDELVASVLVGGDAIDTEGSESLEGAGHHLDRVVAVVDNDGLHDVKLELTSLRTHGASDIVTNDLEAGLVDDFGNDGVDLTGHDGGAGSHGGEVDLMETAARTRGEETEIVADLRELDGDTLDDAVVVGHGTGGGGGGDEVIGELNGEAGDLSEALDDSGGEVGVGSGTSTNGGTTEVDNGESVDGRLEDGEVGLESTGVGGELLAEGHGDGILELGSTHLDDVVELARLSAEGLNEVLHLGDKGGVLEGHTELGRGRIGIVGGLALVDVVVGGEVLVLTLLVAEELESAVGDDLVGVHVGGGTGTTLDHIDDELVVELARDDFVASLLDGLGDLVIDEVESAVGDGASLLGHGESLDEGGEVVELDAGDVVVVDTTEGLDTIVGVDGDLEVTNKIGLDTSGDGTDGISVDGASDGRNNLGNGLHFERLCEREERNVKRFSNEKKFLMKQKKKNIKMIFGEPCGNRGSGKKVPRFAVECGSSTGNCCINLCSGKGRSKNEVWGRADQWGATGFRWILQQVLDRC